MPTTITDTVVLADGSVPAHGRIIFSCREAPDTDVLTATIAVTLGETGEFSVDLEGNGDATAYAVLVECYSNVTDALVSEVRPDVVVDGSGSGTLADYSAVLLPVDASDTAVLRRGATLDFPVQILDEFRRPVDLTGSTVSSRLIGPDGVTRALVAAITDAAGGWISVAMAAASTAVLPLGKHLWDLTVTTGSVVAITPASTITVK